MAELSQALRDAQLTIRARRDYASVDGYQKNLQNRHIVYHQLAYPPRGDQWPGDAQLRPEKLHVTVNKIQPVVYTESHIEAILPRITLNPDTVSPEKRAQAEQAEKLIMRWFDFSDWEVWMPEATQSKATYGKTILKPYWVDADKRPDVSVIETPSIVRLGYGSSDYRELDFAIAESSISPYVAMRRFPEIDVAPPSKAGGPLNVTRIPTSHADPLGTLGPTPGGATGPIFPQLSLARYALSDYEAKQVRLWDYWYKDENGSVWNAFFIDEKLAAPPTQHTEYPDLPFIVIEHDHEPGSPEGVGEVERLQDLQEEFNRTLSHWGQLIIDEIDPAWEINADSVPPGVVPTGGTVIATGSENAHFKEIEKSINIFPVQEYYQTLQSDLHFETGIPDIMFGKPAGAQTAGRALQIQTSSTGNRVDDRKVRFYAGLKKLIAFWTYMAIKKNVSFEVGPGQDNPDGTPGEAQTATYKDVLGDFRHWKIIAPEITPRDDQELVNSTIALLNAKLISVEEAMDRLGVDSPLEMMAKIEKERLNPKYFPGDSQAYVAVLQLIQQYAQTMGQQPAGVPGQGSPQANAAPGGNSGPPLPPGQQGDNGSSVPGSAPPAPAGAPGAPGAAPGGSLGTNQSLIRANPTGGATVLQQTKTSF